ncbi:MAG: hypothetical protein GY811_30130 [Myxococcales bacterium]|nr:hypothetical protein [Myxococcales bacterium]
MMPSQKSLLGTAIVLFGVPVVGATSCADPGKLFSDYDERVYDAGKRNIASGCNGGDIPAISGEYFLALSPSIAPEALLKLIVTTEVDLSVDPAVLSMTFQGLCTQPEQCTVGQPIGDPHVETGIEVTDECGFDLQIDSIILAGGANSLSGSEIDGELQLLGNLQSEEFYCGIVNGIASVGGAPIPIDNSTFGATRVPTGTLGDDLPDPPVASCPDDGTGADAGVADAAI